MRATTALYRTMARQPPSRTWPASCRRKVAPRLPARSSAPLHLRISAPLHLRISAPPHLSAPGPFDGVLGFSQGGSLAHLLCMVQAHDKAHKHGRSAVSVVPQLAASATWEARLRAWAALRTPGGIRRCRQACAKGLAQAAPLNTQAHGLPAFRFAVILSARVTRAPERAPLVAASRQQPICLPTLLVYGGADNEVPAAMTRELRDTFDPACVTEVFLPEGKHRVPMLQPAEAACCRAFVGRFASAGPDAVRAAM